MIQGGEGVGGTSEDSSAKVTVMSDATFNEIIFAVGLSENNKGKAALEIRGMTD